MLLEIGAFVTELADIPFKDERSPVKLSPECVTSKTPSYNFRAIRNYTDEKKQQLFAIYGIRFNEGSS